MEITVNGRIIGEREIARETQYHPSKSLEEARQAAARALVVRELLLQRADRLGIEGTLDDLGESRIRALIERELHVPQADEVTCRRYYETHMNLKTAVNPRRLPAGRRFCNIAVW